MCLAVPSVVVATDGMTATVEAFGRRREVNLLLLDAPVRVGDYLLVQAGGHAFERLEPQAARESLALMEEILAGDGAPDLRAW
jgi:hydrogenase expression/formation protein HypC